MSFVRFLPVAGVRQFLRMFGGQLGLSRGHAMPAWMKSKPFRYVDPVKPWKNRSFEHVTCKNLRKLYVRQGKRTESLPKLSLSIL